MFLPKESLLEARLKALWGRCSLTGTNMGFSPAWYHIDRHYGNSQRRYHTLAHIVHTLGEFDRVAKFLHHPDAVEMAIWFHDIIYEPGAKDNEGKSAELFEFLAADYFAGEFVDNVSRLILATTHQEHTPLGDDSYICDIDLSSFGLPWKEYLKDSNDVRAELAHVPDDQYYEGQLKFLSGLLDRQRIFYTKFFHDCYEIKARENIQRYIRQLKAEGKA